MPSLELLTTNPSLSKTMNVQTDYEVGYGKPPKHTQFPKGQSGNPKGRPKKQQTAKEVMEEMWQGEITANGKKMTRLKAFFLSMMNDGLRGNVTARKILMSLLPQEDECEEFDPKLADQLAMLKAARRWESRAEEEHS